MTEQEYVLVKKETLKDLEDFIQQIYHKCYSKFIKLENIDKLNNILKECGIERKY